MGTFRSQSNSVCDKARKNAINASSLDRILHPTICVSYYWWHKTCLFFDSLLGFWANAVQLPLKIIQSFLWYIHPCILLILPFYPLSNSNIFFLPRDSDETKPNKLFQVLAYYKTASVSSLSFMYISNRCYASTEIKDTRKSADVTWYTCIFLLVFMITASL